MVRQKTHDREVLGSNPRWGDHFSCTIHLDQIMETNLITWHCCMCCNPANGRVDFVDGWPRPKSNGRGENHLGRRVPSSQTSLYRLLWGKCNVHRPLFTGRPSGLGVQGKCQVYRSLPIGRWQKKNEDLFEMVLVWEIIQLYSYSSMLTKWSYNQQSKIDIKLFYLNIT